MAKLGEQAFSFTEIPNFLRIPISCDDDQHFLNVGKTSVIKIRDKKPLHTWTLTHPNNFTSPVVYTSETLLCVVNNNVLMRWSVNEDSLKEAEKIKFQEPVFALIPVISKQPLVLFNSGKYAVINATDFYHTKPCDTEILKENEELIWAETSEDIKLSCLAYNEKSKSYSLYNCTVNENKQDETSLHCHTISRESAVLKSWCLNKYNSSFLSAWSDGVICLHKMKDFRESILISMKDLESNSAVAITCIDSTHIAVAKGSSKQKECALEIWDTRFSVLKARKVIKTTSLDNLQITASNSYIFLCSNKELISIPFSVEHSTLAAAVGKSISEINKTLEFSWNAKGQLLQIPPMDVPELMDVSESKQDSSDSAEAIAQRLLNQNTRYLAYIPESELAKLLRLAIRYNKEDSSKNSSKSAAFVIFNFVFSASFNDIFLVKYLKRMNLEETLVAIELLLSYLNSTIDLPPNVTERPSDLQIVNWACLIIQSHMEALLFSKDKLTKKLLRKFENALYIKMEEYEDYEGLQNYFTILQKKNFLPEKCSVGKYCIETLDI